MTRPVARGRLIFTAVLLLRLGVPAASVLLASQPAPAEAASLTAQLPWEEGDDVVWNEPAAGLAPWQILLLILAGLAVIAGGAVYLYSRRVTDNKQGPVQDEHGEWPLPPLVIPARLAAGGTNRRGPDLNTQRPAPASRAQSEPAPAARQTRRPSAARSAPGAGSAGGTASATAEPPGEAVQAGPIHFHRPPEGTLQLLPGRLEIVSGDERHDEIRFVRVAGRDAVVTFGRSEGEPHLHIRLQSRTVSRLHASMRYDQGRWHVGNLSRTNPVVLNGVQMPTADGRLVALSDGDEIEMGEVIFRFRSR